MIKLECRRLIEDSYKGLVLDNGETERNEIPTIDNETMKRILDYNLEDIRHIINLINEYDLQSNQDVLDYMDELNKISITF